jgi:hypothetical protein
MERRLIGVGVASIAAVSLIAAIVEVGVVRRSTMTGPIYTVRQYLAPPTRRHPVPRRWHLHPGEIMQVRGVLNHSPLSKGDVPGNRFVRYRQFRRDRNCRLLRSARPARCSPTQFAFVARLIALPATANHPLTGRFATYHLRVIRCRTIYPKCPARATILQLVDGVRLNY